MTERLDSRTRANDNQRHPQESVRMPHSENTGRIREHSGQEAAQRAGPDNTMWPIRAENSAALAGAGAPRKASTARAPPNAPLEGMLLEHPEPQRGVSAAAYEHEWPLWVRSDTWQRMHAEMTASPMPWALPPEHDCKSKLRSRRRGCQTSATRLGSKVIYAPSPNLSKAEP